MPRRSVAALLFGCCALTACSTEAAGQADRQPTQILLAREAAAEFLDRYVDPDGRVVRRDQGSDTVSEGQSYGLLLAQVAQRPDIEQCISRWTERLRRPDGLLSFLAGSDGVVLDPQAASDGDLVVAWAWRRGGSGPSAPLADAVLQQEVVERDGLRLLAAGPWATGEPATLNPSYWVLPAYESLGADDPSWQALADASLRALDQLTDGGALLPSDWARVDGAALSPSPAPSGAVPEPRYGLDAQRTVVWLAASCDRQARRTAAGWWPLLADPARSNALALSLDGQVLDPSGHPLPLVAAAAAAHAAGETEDRDRLLDQAAAQDQRVPTYYGAAWVALGRTLLQTDLLRDCEPES
jgi:endoglucanase